jgi:predicted DNA-binding antitoxin AbrB/MazE fold protein|tara:strand:+ start:571 stop:762 length:192 start_codon:yes stop_codon:yes gene_type:complete
MVIKAKYEDGKFIPMKESRLDNIESGDIIELQIISRVEEITWKGALNHIKKNSVELQHEIKNN